MAARDSYWFDLPHGEKELRLTTDQCLDYIEELAHTVTENVKKNQDAQRDLMGQIDSVVADMSSHLSDWDDAFDRLDLEGRQNDQAVWKKIGETSKELEDMLDQINSVRPFQLYYEQLNLWSAQVCLFILKDRTLDGNPIEPEVQKFVSSAQLNMQKRLDKGRLEIDEARGLVERNERVLEEALRDMDIYLYGDVRTRTRRHRMIQSRSAKSSKYVDPMRLPWKTDGAPERLGVNRSRNDHKSSKEASSFTPNHNERASGPSPSGNTIRPSKDVSSLPDSLPDDKADKSRRGRPKTRTDSTPRGSSAPPLEHDHDKSRKAHRSPMPKKDDFSMRKAQSTSNLKHSSDHAPEPPPPMPKKGASVVASKKPADPKFDQRNGKPTQPAQVKSTPKPPKGRAEASTSRKPGNEVRKGVHHSKSLGNINGAHLE